MKKDVAFDARQTLRDAGFKATPARLRLLEVLAGTDMPLTVAEIQRLLKGKVDGVTVYRALEAFSAKGITTSVDFHHGHTHYELVTGRKHHHHVICTNCSAVEDISVCSPVELEKHALQKTHHFKSIYSHEVAFFGLCEKCTV